MTSKMAFSRHLEQLRVVKKNLMDYHKSSLLLAHILPYSQFHRQYQQFYKLPSLTLPFPITTSF